MESNCSIVFFVDSLSGGGAERIATLLANNFSERAYKVTVVTIKKPLPTDYYLSPKVDRASLSAAKISSNAVIALKNNAALIVKLRYVLKDLKPKYVVSLMTQANVVCGIACVRLNTIHIASERNYPPMQSIGVIWNFLRKYGYKLPDIVVSQTDKTSRWIVRNTKCTKSAVIPNPVIFPLPQSSSKVSPQSKITITTEQKVILGVGRLVDQKQFDNLITTFSKIAKDYPDWIVIIVGEGPNREKLQKKIDSLELQQRIHLIGKQANMGYWYKQAEIFVLSSKFEGYPNVLLEAMCHGVPSISYNCDTGPDSIIEHGHNGLLVPVGDTIQLASSILSLIDDPVLKMKLGDNAREIVDSHSIDSIIDKWESVLTALIS